MLARQGPRSQIVLGAGQGGLASAAKGDYCQVVLPPPFAGASWSLLLRKGYETQRFTTQTELPQLPSWEQTSLGRSSLDGISSQKARFKDGHASPSAGAKRPVSPWML